MGGCGWRACMGVHVHTCLLLDLFLSLPGHPKDLIGNVEDVLKTDGSGRGGRSKVGGSRRWDWKNP